MLCVVCGKLSPNMFADTDNGRVEFHSACAVCHVCEKPNADQFAMNVPTSKLIFIHQSCAFTPEQMDLYLALQHDYHPE